MRSKKTLDFFFSASVLQFPHSIIHYCLLFLFSSLLPTPPSFFSFLFFFFLFRASPPAYGSSRARGRISCQPTPQPWATSATYTATWGNTRSLTHWGRPGIKPTSSQRRRWALNPLSHHGNSPILFLLCVRSGGLGKEIMEEEWLNQELKWEKLAGLESCIHINEVKCGMSGTQGCSCSYV